MQNFFKKRPSQNAANGTASKRAKTANENNLAKCDAPRTIVSWNCNGLTSRLRGGDMTDIKTFVTKHNPDAIFLSEVRVAAANSSNGGKPGPNTKWYRSKMRNSDKKSAEDCGLVNSFLFSKELSKYKPYFSLADTKYSGTAMLLNVETTQEPISVRYNLDGKEVKGSVHDPEGRIIVAKFKNATILHTYSPNNGWDEGHFERRRLWDARIKDFVERKRAAGVQLVWIGDLNVAPLDADLSHPSYYRTRKGGKNPKGGKANIAQGDVGQPGCTDKERKRFAEILKAGGMVDAYRHLIGEDDSSGFSWRGHPTGMHGGRGMRIDHCIVAQGLLPNVSSVEITGHGSDRKGFLGSDHCPLVIKFTQTSEAEKAEPGEDLKV